MSGGQSPYPRHQLEDFTPGAVREQRLKVTRADLDRFSDVSGDRHPLHGDSQFAQSRGFSDVLVHGMLITSRCSAFIAHDFVGSHGLLVSMQADFRQPVFCDEELVWRAEVARIDAAATTVEIRWKVANSRGVIVQVGGACAWLPKLP